MTYVLTNDLLPIRVVLKWTSRTLCKYWDSNINIFFFFFFSKLFQNLFISFTFDYKKTFYLSDSCASFELNEITRLIEFSIFNIYEHLNFFYWLSMNTFYWYFIYSYRIFWICYYLCGFYGNYVVYLRETKSRYNERYWCQSLVVMKWVRCVSK